MNLHGSSRQIQSSSLDCIVPLLLMKDSIIPVERVRSSVRRSLWCSLHPNGSHTVVEFVNQPVNPTPVGQFLVLVHPVPPCWMAASVSWWACSFCWSFCCWLGPFPCWFCSFCQFRRVNVKWFCQWASASWAGCTP